MRGWIIAGCVLLALFLLGQLRVGAAAAYDEGGLALKLKLGPGTVQLLPRKKKAGKEKKKKEKKPRKQRDRNKAGPQGESPAKKKKPDTLSLALKFVPLAAQAAGKLLRKIHIDTLALYVIWGAEDPASAAKGYGAANAALGMLWPVIDQNFRVKERDLGIDVDFQRNSPTLTADVQATLTVGQCLALAISLGIQALKIYLGVRREQEKP